MSNMTYGDLLEHLKNMPEDRLKDNVSFKDPEGDFLIANKFLAVLPDSEESGTLDVGHYYLTHEED